jgi:hypothetical protein
MTESGLHDALAMLLKARSWDESAEVVDAYPELLSSEALEVVAQAVDAAGPDDLVHAHLADLRELLSACREAGDASPLRNRDTLTWGDVAEGFDKQFHSAVDQFHEYQASGDRASLDASVSTWAALRDNVELPHTPNTFQLAVLDGAATASLTRFFAYGEPEDLERGLALSRTALERTGPDSDRRVRRLTNLAGALSARFDLTADPEIVDEAIDRAREAVDCTSPSAHEWPGRVNNLAGALSNRYRHSGRLEDLDESIALLRRALGLAASDAPDLRPALPQFGCGSQTAIRTRPAAGDAR